MRFLSNAPFGRFSLAMHPSGQIFLKALFFRSWELRGPPGGGFWPQNPPLKGGVLNTFKTLQKTQNTHKTKKKHNTLTPVPSTPI